VPGMNLTRDEARERARILTVDSYDVDLDLTTGETTFSSTTVIRFSCSEPGAATFVDLVAPRVREISLNGMSLDPQSHDGLRIPLEGLAPDNELRVVADCAYMNTGEGLHRFVDPVDGSVYLYSQFEVADARRVYANFEQPDLKARFTLTVTAPVGWQVVSNSPTPEPEPVTGNEDAARWRFPTTQPLSTYVTALVAGPYHVVRGSHEVNGQTIPLGVFCRSSLAPYLDAEEILRVTRAGFDYYVRQFAYPYPFEKYDQLFVPEFNAGAMENAGCVTFLEDYVFRSKVTDAAYERRAETILHEMAHMWFGDLVTMRWWDDLWLNESFATFASVLCQAEVTRWHNAWTTFANTEKTWALRQDQLPSTHPIVADINDLEDVEVNFDGITYAKGASVLKQLVAWVGPEQFFEGVRDYFAKHQWGNTTLRDLLSALEKTSGRDLGTWSSQWLETAGVNTLRPEITCAEDGTVTAFAVRQEATADHPTLRPHRVAIGYYDRTGDGLVRTHRVEIDITDAHTDVPELTGRVRPDLILLNDDDLTFAKIRLDPVSLTTLTEAISEFDQSLPRALCWTAAWDMVRDAEIPARDYLTLVLSGIGRERDIGVVQTLQRQARSAIELFAEPGFRETGRRALADTAHRELFEAAPGSDHQLAWIRCLASVASSPEHLRLLQELLDGDTSVPGLTVDTDLRWALLLRLVSTGNADEAEIDAELDRDSTATGQRHAASCLAARPTSEAKREAWSSVVERGDLPNAIQSAVIGGFVQPEQRELLEPFIDRYFTVLCDVWATRTNEIAQRIVNGFFPSMLVDPRTLEATDAFLSSQNPTPALRRLVLEGRDGVARSLRAQERDRSAGTAG
jgi:aminopeptidase N